MTRESKKEKNIPRSNLFSLIMKQIIAASVFFAFVLGMLNCGNTYLEDYSDALGRALRYNTDWTTAVSSVSNWLSGIFSLPQTPDNNAESIESTPSSNEETIIFQ